MHSNSFENDTKYNIQNALDFSDIRKGVLYKSVIFLS